MIFINMKIRESVVFCILFAALVGQSPAFADSTEWNPPPQESGSLAHWKCPTNDCEVYWSGDNATYTVSVLSLKGSRIVKDIDSNIFSDYLGIGSLPARKFRWKGDLLLTMDQSGLGVLDTSQARFLINNTFDTFLEVSPDRFFVHSFLPAPRHGEWDYSGFDDKVYVIDLGVLHTSNPSQHMVDHVYKAIDVGGVMASPFIQLNKLNVGAFVVKDSILSFIDIHTDSVDGVKRIPIGKVGSETIDHLKDGGLDPDLATKYNSKIDVLR
jgi:hypothetical protein